MGRFQRNVFWMKDREHVRTDQERKEEQEEELQEFFVGLQMQKRMVNFGEVKKELRRKRELSKTKRRARALDEVYFPARFAGIQADLGDSVPSAELLLTQSPSIGYIAFLSSLVEALNQCQHSSAFTHEISAVTSHIYEEGKTEKEMEGLFLLENLQKVLENIRPNFSPPSLSSRESNQGKARPFSRNERQDKELQLHVHRFQCLLDKASQFLLSEETYSSTNEHLGEGNRDKEERNAYRANRALIGSIMRGLFLEFSKGPSEEEL